MSGKRLAFVLSVMILWTNAAQAETSDASVAIGGSEPAGNRLSISDIMKIGIYPFRNGVATQDNPGISKPESEVSPEEAILARWKEKQLGQWNELPKGKFEINASAYTASTDECGKSDGTTASGLHVVENRTIACPPSYPFGVKVAIEGFGTFRCEDRGGAIKGNRFDIYMRTKAEAFAFGRRYLIAEVLSD